MQLVVSGLLNKQIAGELRTSEIGQSSTRSGHAQDGGRFAGGTGQNGGKVANLSRQVRLNLTPEKYQGRHPEQST
jgi:FixJ family two-component response regulator